MEADKLLEQANKLGTQASTQTGVPFTAITPKSLTETPKLATLPTVPVSTTAQGISATAGAMSEQAKLNAERDKQLAASRSAVEEQKGVYQGLVEQITGVFGQKDKLATQYKLDEKEQRLTDISKKIDESEQAQREEIRALENSGLTDVQKAQQSREINRKYAFEQADLAVKQSAANLDFDSAQKMIERKINLQLEPLKFQLDFSKGFYDEVKNDLDTATKNDFDAKIKQLDRQFKSEEENRNAIGELQITALKNGIDIPQSVLNKLNNAKDVNEAASILANAGISLAKPEKVKTEKLTVDEKKSNAVSNFSSAFVFGAKLPDGTGIIGSDGYINPKAWKAAIADAPNEGLTRAEFIKSFGYLLNPINTDYGLTPAEEKLVKGVLPE